MTTTTTRAFKNMRIGTKFWIDTGDPEYDYQVYKISATECVKMHDAYMRETVDKDESFVLAGRIDVSPTTVTDIERVAVTMLHDALRRYQIQHSVFRAWATKIGTDAKFYEMLDIWADEPAQADLLTRLAKDGFLFPENRWGTPCFSSQIQDGNYGNTTTQYQERAAYDLANAIIHYRMMGRPAGDMTHSINGMGGEALLNVSTSLAAAVVEYHNAITRLQ